MKTHNDYYAKKAKTENFAARSVYKLDEIQKKYSLIKKNMKILDLGSSPGSWVQYINEIVSDKGFVLAIDINDVNISFGKNVKFFKTDVFTSETFDLISQYSKFDGLVSDMAPLTTGARDYDHFGSMELCERAFDLAQNFLKQNGFFVCKMFEGEDSPEFIKKVRKCFSFFKAIRPKATKKQSREVFLVGNGYKVNSSSQVQQ